MLVGQVERFEDVRERRIPAGDTLHWCLQTEEAFLLNGGRNFCAESVGQRSFMGDQSSTRFLDGL